MKFFNFFFSAHQSDQMSEGSQVSKVTLCVEILKWQSALTTTKTKVRYRAARAAKNTFGEGWASWCSPSRRRLPHCPTIHSAARLTDAKKKWQDNPPSPSPVPLTTVTLTISNFFQFSEFVICWEVYSYFHFFSSPKFLIRDVAWK